MTITENKQRIHLIGKSDTSVIRSQGSRGALIEVVCLLLFYTTATLFQLYSGGDMMYEMRRRKPEPTCLPTQWIFNLPHHVGMV